MKHTHTSISIVICTYNGAARIEKVLSCFEHQLHCEDITWEIIVVDNNSTDHTYETVQNCLPRFGEKLKLVQETKQGLIHARIKGYQASQYTIISYIDDDNYVANDWIYHVFTVMSTGADIGACGGYNELYREEASVVLPSWLAQFKSAYALGGQDTQPEAYVEHLWGSGLSIRRTILDILFTDRYHLLLNGRTGEGLASGEDSEIVYATQLLHWKLFYTDKLKLQHHIGPQRFTFDYLKKLYNAFGTSHVVLTPYLSYLHQHSRFDNVFKYSQIWQVVYGINSFKIVYYSVLYTLNLFSEKRKRYILLIIFLVSLNKELLKRRNTYKNIFLQIKRLLRYKRTSGDSL